jgi:hypothetical protein
MPSLCVRFAILVSVLIAFSLESQAQYIRGPRGGCYTLTRSGNKRYVDRSMCDSPSPQQSTRRSLSDSGGSEKRASSPASNYIRGPRGGCYTLGAGGRKRYVDHSLCDGAAAATSQPLSAGAPVPQGREIHLRTPSRYIRGPRGGCYTVSSSGRKRYVDRSMCD